MPRLDHIAPMRSDDARVTTLELFFDLVFVLAITQCTALMAAGSDWISLVHGVTLLALLWWSWVGYTWLTSVVEPELVEVRLPMFAAMGALLVVALCIPEAYGDNAVGFVAAYAIVRVAQLALLGLTSRGDAKLRRSLIGGIGISTLTAIVLLSIGVLGSATVQTIVWPIALALDLAGPYLFGSEGWKMSPAHFAERHGLIVIIALGESIVAIGVGTHQVTLSIAAEALVAIALVSSLWWVYFDVLAHVAERRLHAAAPGKERNEMARDAYSYLHFPMVAGIALSAVGLKTTFGHASDPLHWPIAVALAGGIALYLVGLYAFGRRTTGRSSWDALVAAALVVAGLVFAPHIPAWASLSALTVLLCLLVVYKVTRYHDPRHRVRSTLVDVD